MNTRILVISQPMAKYEKTEVPLDELVLFDFPSVENFEEMSSNAPVGCYSYVIQTSEYPLYMFAEIF